jgi:hypothetical protein
MIQWLIDNQELATLLFTAVVTLSTVVYAVLTAVLVFETRKMRRVQTEPRLWVYYQLMEEHIHFGHLFIKNIGQGPAFDIEIDLVAEDSDEGGRLIISDLEKVKAFCNGVSYLGPGQHIKSGFSSFLENYEDKIKSVITAKIHYKGASGDKYREVFRIDFSEFEGAGRLGTPNLYAIAQSLEKIQKDVSQLSTGLKKLKVLTYTHEDRERETREWKEQREEMIRKDKGKDA